jgi:hypothetical protein
MDLVPHMRIEHQRHVFDAQLLIHRFQPAGAFAAFANRIFFAGDDKDVLIGRDLL